MADESNEGVQYLRALKQFSSPQPSRTAPQGSPRRMPPEPTAASSNIGDRFQGPEKRRSPRYKCEGSAEIREDGREVPTWATFSDISMHGCYVEAQATYPVGTVLQMKLQSNGIRVEAKGTVRVSYPHLGMGIAFTEITAPARTQLRELLSTISRPSVIMGPGIASAHPSAGPMGSVPLITNPTAAIQALLEFFETRHILTREDFLTILSKSQAIASKR